MKFHATQDLELKVAIRAALKENDFYCPCVVNSRGNEEYKCPCKNFREETPAGEICHCGLYIKDEE